MGSRAETIAHLLDALDALPLSARKMFGEYALYLDGKVVALVCDDRIFVKPLPEALALMPEAGLAPPYPGARPHLVADAALDEDGALQTLLGAVARALPPPKPKRPKAKA